MLTDARSSGGPSENISMRSTRATIRSVSSQISRVRVRSSSPAFCSRSCAAPRMPDSGFFTSCASSAAMAVTERAALRWTNWRSILRAMERSWSDTTTWAGASASGAASIETKRGAPRGSSTVTPVCATLWAPWRTCRTRAKMALSSGSAEVSGRFSRFEALASNNCSAAGLT